MKKAFRAGIFALAILGFVVVFSVNSKTEWHLRNRGMMPDEMQRSRVYLVGLEPSPWLTYKIDELQPDGSTYSGLDLYASSWSWLVLAAAIASVWAYLKLSLVAAAPTDRPSA
jgi:hypothetical protein